jgi:hypothetical protein
MMLKHFGMVLQSLSLSISLIIWQGSFQEQLEKLSINIKNFEILKYKMT